MKVQYYKENFKMNLTRKKQLKLHKEHQIFLKASKSKRTD